jgi:ATP-dependent Lon protease
MSSKAVELDIDPDVFERTDVHLHVPVGAIPKGGPSAGVAMVVAITSVLSERPAHHNVAMIGEITLCGRVLPVGGVKMKVLAVHRAGLNTVIVPKWNERVLDERPEDVRQSMTLISVRPSKIAVFGPNSLPDFWTRIYCPIVPIFDGF